MCCRKRSFGLHYFSASSESTTALASGLDQPAPLYGEKAKAGYQAKKADCRAATQRIADAGADSSFIDLRVVGAET